MGTESPMGVMKIFWKYIEVMLHNIEKILNTIGLNFQMINLCYENFTSIIEVTSEILIRNFKP